MAKTGTIRAAGVVLLRQGPNGPLVCVLHRPRQNDWSLPKGKLDPGESVVEAARRETIEETGCDVSLGIPLRTQRYRVMDNRMKTVEYWVGRERAGGPGFVPNREVDELRWLPPEAAMATLTYPRDGDLVQEALSAPLTSPLIVLRHTEAMRRSDFDGTTDSERPLSPLGQEQAQALVGVLDAFGVTKVYSSDYTRCLDTVRPFAVARHAVIAHEPLLGEDGFAASRQGAFKRTDSMIEDWEPAVICTHRPVLPALVVHIADRLGLDEVPDAALAPGAALVFHRDGKRCVAVERLSV